MLKQYLIISVVVGLVVFCIGCSPKNTPLDNNWGRSYETAKYRQIVDPEASQNLEPVVDLDGQAADANVEKYRDTFKERRRQETVNILKLQ